MSTPVEQHFSLVGKTALVTGAHTGIGRATALALAACGANLILWDRKLGPELDGVAEKARSVNVAVETVGLDLADLAAVRERARAIATESKIDILVNNAGTIRRAPILNTTTADWRDVLTVNLDAVFVLSQELGAHMVSRSEGSIVNVASLLSFQGGMNVAAYTASKHAVAGLTRAMANEFAARGVNVNAVAAGYIKTNNTAALRANPERKAQISSRIPAGRWGEPDDVAWAITFLCSPAARYIHGQILVVDGGWMSW